MSGICKIFRVSLFLGLVAITLFFEIGVIIYIIAARDLPKIPPFDQITFPPISKIRATHGQALAEVFDERRYILPLDKIPPLLINAFIASEDSRFFEHSGLDIIGIARAIVSNIRAGEIREGASTITQQVARVLLLSREKTIQRKIKEAILARRLEDVYSKDQILSLYLNLIYMGKGAYGVEAAARTYFGHSVADLSIAECATIAALPQAPGKINPVSNPQLLKEKRDRILQRMADAGYITEVQAQKAMSQPITAILGRDNMGDRAPYTAIYAMQVAKEIQEKVEKKGLLEGGEAIIIDTTIDLGLQLIAEKALREGVNVLDQRQGYRGPIAHIEKEKWDEFLIRNRDFLLKHGLLPDPPSSRAILGLVTEVKKLGAHVSITPDMKGVIPISLMSWASPYVEFPKDANGERIEIQNVSLDKKIDDATLALKTGDIVLVTVVSPPPLTQKTRDKTSLIENREGKWLKLVQLPKPQGALLAYEPRSGYILAQVGGTDYDISQVDRTRSLRQSGSAIKPIYYSKAYDIGIPPSYLVSGAPIREGLWTPEGEKAVKDMTLWEALTKSENNISLRVFKMVLAKVGVESLNDFIHRLGMNTKFKGLPAEGLGIDVTPKELLVAFSTFYTSGMKIDDRMIKLITDSNNTVILDKRSPRDPLVPVLDAIKAEIREGKGERVMSKETAYITAMNLKNVAEEGTAKRAKSLGRPVFGKTGTLPFDVWFVGFTNEIAAVTWVGEDNRERYLGKSRTSGNVFGADTALPIFLDFMQRSLKGIPVKADFPYQPEGVVMVPIDLSTGLLAREGFELIPHLIGTEPTVYTTDAQMVTTDIELADF